jgi:multidrug efflux pump subunit AcrB
MGKTPYQAAIDAADEIGLAVVATTFSIVAVFLPVAMMPGVSGQFFKNFGLTVVVAVLFSLLVARMITPMVAAYFMTSHGEAEHGGGVWMDRYMKVLHWSLDTDKAQARRAGLIPVAGLGGIRWSCWRSSAGRRCLCRGFRRDPALVADAAARCGATAGVAGGRDPCRCPRLFHRHDVCPRGARSAGGVAWLDARARLGALVDHRLWMMGIGLGALVLTFVLMQAIPTQFFPDTDTDESQIDVEMVPGTTIEQTEAKMDEVLALVAHEQEVRVALERIKEGSGHIFLQLRRDRHRTSVKFERDLTPSSAGRRRAGQFRQPEQRRSGQRLRPRDQRHAGGVGPRPAPADGSDAGDADERASAGCRPAHQRDLRRPEIVITPHFDLAASLGVTTQA